MAFHCTCIGCFLCFKVFFNSLTKTTSFITTSFFSFMTQTGIVFLQVTIPAFNYTSTASVIHKNFAHSKIKTCCFVLNQHQMGLFTVRISDLLTVSETSNEKDYLGEFKHLFCNNQKNRKITSVKHPNATH